MVIPATLLGVGVGGGGGGALGDCCVGTGGALAELWDSAGGKLVVDDTVFVGLNENVTVGATGVD
jgi:hypothetical protein